MSTLLKEEDKSILNILDLDENIKKSKIYIISYTQIKFVFPKNPYFFKIMVVFLVGKDS